MECDHCRREAILFQPYSGQHLCDRHFALDLERRAKRVIRKNRWISSKDRVALAVRGNGRGMALLYFMGTVFGKRRDLSFFVLPIDERDGERAGEIKRWVNEFGFEQIRISLQDGHLEPQEDWCSCSAGTEGDHRIWSIAQEHGATRIALDATVEDEAYDMVKDILCGDVSRLFTSDSSLVCIRPFHAIPEEEVLLYAHIKTGIPLEARSSMDGSGLRKELQEFSSRRPATPFALAQLREGLMKNIDGHTDATQIRPSEDISSRAHIPQQHKEDRNAV